MENQSNETFIGLLHLIFGGLLEILKLAVSQVLKFGLPVLAIIALNKYEGIQPGFMFGPVLTFLIGFAYYHSTKDPTKDLMTVIVFGGGALAFIAALIVGGITEDAYKTAFLALLSFISFTIGCLGLVNLKSDLQAKEN